MRKRRWWIGAAAAVVVAAIAGMLVLRHAASPAAPGDAAPAVELATVRTASYDVVLDESGRVGPPAGTASQLAFPNAGILRAIYVRVGERVSQGEALAALDRRPLALAAAQAEADAQSAQAQAAAASVDKYATQLAVDRAAYARAQRLYIAGVDAAKDVQSARAQLAADEAAARSYGADRRAAAAAASSARAHAQLAQTDLAYATLRAPSDGVVTAVLRRVGESADPSTPVVVVGPAQQAEVTLQVPAMDAQQIAPGDMATVRAVGSSAQASCRVSAVVAAVDPTTQAATIVAGCVPPAAVAGAAVRARITVARVVGLVAPQSAIVTDPQSGDDVVFVQTRAKNGEPAFELRVVQVAHEDGRSALIRAGLKPGERIAAQGAFELLAPSGGGD